MKENRHIAFNPRANPLAHVFALIAAGMTGKQKAAPAVRQPRNADESAFRVDAAIAKRVRRNQARLVNAYKIIKGQPASMYLSCPWMERDDRVGGAR